ncbi:hypothetical protein CHS0354_007089 [Potamilus streckersoni]|uniref:Hexosyltransferase n=1 Tax=Potamilus streckersoni TaxID=2493646 RepID=A0AAE0TC40_9BIVA|nr:hypothetical protein CHS0354_007089 [Potamilus streckersoni]
MVHSAVLKFDRRKSLRETWANPRLLQNHPAWIVFLVGKTKSSTSQKALEIESETFSDVVQGDFIDDYHNLTHKGIHGYRWIVKYCEKVQFILKIDDDVFVNIFLVIRELLPKYQEGQRLIVCRFITEADIDRYGKYAVDPDYFPGYKRSPLQCCMGAFVLMLSNIVLEMYETAKNIPFYWIDDFYYLAFFQIN